MNNSDLGIPTCTSPSLLWADAGTSVYVEKLRAHIDFQELTGYEPGDATLHKAGFEIPLNCFMKSDTKSF